MLIFFLWIRYTRLSVTNVNRTLEWDQYGEPHAEGEVRSLKVEGSWSWRDRHPRRSRVEQDGFTTPAFANPSLQPGQQREKYSSTHWPTSLVERNYQIQVEWESLSQDNNKELLRKSLNINSGLHVHMCAQPHMWTHKEQETGFRGHSVVAVEVVRSLSAPVEGEK